MGRIVVGVDGSENSAAALEWAIGEARVRGATVEAVLGWHEPIMGGTAAVMIPVDTREFEESYRAQLDKAVDAVVGGIGDLGGVEIDRQLVHAPAARSLLDAAVDADLLVVGRRGHGGFLGLVLGSISQQVVWHAPCPVVVVPAPGS
ncbi:universal stress protein [Actinospongicola halichondriae]|uniref:universal stress protein n=1 Tax=Actinospongicola halichondriae TaxID=3236844 RepID=UPI003D5ABC3C